jgi:hypothetical protein
MRQLMILACLLNISGIIAQNVSHEKISVSFEYSRQQFAMDSLNKHYVGFYIDTLGWLDKKISSGHRMGISINYRLNKFLETGLKFSHQYGQTEKTTQIEVYGLNPSPYETDMWWNITTSATSIQMSNTFYLSPFIDGKVKSTILRRIEFGVEFNLGYSWNKFSSYYHFIDITEPNYAYMNHDFLVLQNRSTHASLGFKVDFNFLNNSFISRLGIKSGYQFLRTGAIRKNSGDEMIFLNSAPMNLDFSGWYYGIYLKFGR